MTYDKVEYSRDSIILIMQMLAVINSDIAEIKKKLGIE
jgi:hypothetical protein